MTPSLPAWTPPPDPHKKRTSGGAPLGNRNALKHGFYSRSLTVQERALPWSARDTPFQSEINLIRVLVDRTAQKLKPGAHDAPLTFNGHLLALHTITLALHHLYSLYSVKGRVMPPPDETTLWQARCLGYTEQDLVPYINGTPALKSGAQPGNTNALKHGFYSSSFKSAELHRLDEAESNRIVDEIALMRTLIKRLFDSMSADRGIALPDYLRAVRIITLATACIERLENLFTRVYNPPPTLEEEIEQGIETAVAAMNRELKISNGKPAGHTPARKNPPHPKPPGDCSSLVPQIQPGEGLET